MPVGMGATVIAREVAGVDVASVGSWVRIEVVVSVEEAGVGVAIAVVDSGVPWGGGVGDDVRRRIRVWNLVPPLPRQTLGSPPESAQSGSLVIRVLLSF